MSSGDGVPLVPFRNGSTKSFDFFDDNDDESDSDVKPAEGDSDFYYSSSSSADDTYYVQFFAVGVAFDEATLSNTYSRKADAARQSCSREGKEHGKRKENSNRFTNSGSHFFASRMIVLQIQYCTASSVFQMNKG